MLTSREALEAALVRSPDDLTLHMAYADLLIEVGDSRGEWIRMNLEEELPPKSQKELDHQERRKAFRHEYYLQHRIDWLGSLARLETPPNYSSPPVLRLHWKRGLLRGLDINAVRDDVVDEVRSHPLFQSLFHLLLFTDTPASYTFLHTWPPTPLETLSVFDPHFGDQELDLLLRSPCFPKERLTFGRCLISDRGAAMIANLARVVEMPHIHWDNTLFGEVGYYLMKQSGISFSSNRPVPVMETIEETDSNQDT